MINITLVDDHKMFRDGLRFALSQVEDFNVINDFNNGVSFLEGIKNEMPDIVLMDIGMPKMDGAEATQEALKIYPNIKIIALSMFSDVEYYHKMVSIGVKGFLMKESGINELEKAIRNINSGGTYFSQELLQEIIIHISNPKVNSSNNKVTDLTRREEEVLNLICKGYDNKEIAEMLFISQKTVEGHKTNLMSKTNTKNSINLMLFAIKNNLIDFKPSDQ
ncbi:MAG: DNA-binding response regulator [Thalassobius sp.]|nr:DNA-binding response regulator [Thalassovita sp.]